MSCSCILSCEVHLPTVSHLYLHEAGPNVCADFIISICPSVCLLAGYSEVVDELLWNFFMG